MSSFRPSHPIRPSTRPTASNVGTIASNASFGPRKASESISRMPPVASVKVVHWVSTTPLVVWLSRWERPVR